MTELLDKLKRIGATLLGVALVALNKRLNLNLGAEELMTLAVLIVSYVTSGTWKAAALEKAKVDAEKAAGTVTDLKTAADTLAKAAQ